MGFSINITNENILDKIYFKLFLYKWRLRTKIVISKPKITQTNIRLINDRANKDELTYFHVTTDR